MISGFHHGVNCVGLLRLNRRAVSGGLVLEGYGGHETVSRHGIRMSLSTSVLVARIDEFCYLIFMDSADGGGLGGLGFR